MEKLTDIMFHLDTVICLLMTIVPGLIIFYIDHYVGWPIKNTKKGEQTMKNEYIIVGDVENLGTCLIYVCGTSREWADKLLDRMLNNPTEDDIKAMKGFTNLKVEEVPPEDCWWNGDLD